MYASLNSMKVRLYVVLAGEPRRWYGLMGWETNLRLGFMFVVVKSVLVCTGKVSSKVKVVRGREKEKGMRLRTRKRNKNKNENKNE